MKTRDQWAINVKTIVRVLRAASINSREDLVQRYDKHSNYRNIKGLDRVLGPQLREMVDSIGYDEWEATTGMPWDGRKE